MWGGWEGAGGSPYNPRVTVPPRTAGIVLLAFGALGMLVPGLPAVGGFDVAAVSARTWALGAFIVVFPTALAYLLNYCF